MACSHSFLVAKASLGLLWALVLPLVNHNTHAQSAQAVAAEVSR
jgi:hypothetical protein